MEVHADHQTIEGKGMEKGLERKRDFVYLISKCSMLYIHMDIDTKKSVLDAIKEFIEKLQETFLKSSSLASMDQQQKKEKILSALIPFLQNLTTNYMIEHITVYDSDKRDFIIKDIEISSYNQAKRAVPLPTSTSTHTPTTPSSSSSPSLPEKKMMPTKSEAPVAAASADWGKEERIKGVIKEKMDGFTEKVTSHIDQKVIDLYDEIQRYFEKKFSIENDKLEKGLEKGLTTGLGNQREYSKRYMDEVTEMIREEIAEYVENRNEAFVEENYGRVRDEIRDKVEMELETLVKSEISAKVEKLTHILNKNLESSMKQATEMNQGEIEAFIETKIRDYEYMIKNTPLTLSYEKTTNTLHLINTQEGSGESGMVISSIQLPSVAGPQGPQGPSGPQGPQGTQGPQGPPGLSPVLKNLDITRDGHLSVMVQDAEGTYELKSLNRLPMPSGHVASIPTMAHAQHQTPVQSQVIEKRVSVQELNFDREHVMRLDSQNENTLIILKSLSIGENSHCVKSNSVAVGGATCFQENSLAIGPKAHAIARNSVALYGSTSGENAFAYRATNVPSNQLVFGSANKEEGYNIQKIVLNAEHIHLNSNNIRISAYEDKIRSMEAKIEQLEKMMAGGASQRYASVDASVSAPSGSRNHQSNSSNNANMGGYGGLSSIASLFSPAQPVHEVFYGSK